MVPPDGFEPPVPEAPDLQSGTDTYFRIVGINFGRHERTRTSNHLVMLRSKRSSFPFGSCRKNLVPQAGFEPAKTYGLNVVTVPICLVTGANKQVGFFSLSR